MKSWQVRLLSICYFILFFSLPGSIAGLEIGFFLLFVSTIIVKLTGGKFNNAIGGKSLWCPAFLFLLVLSLSSFWHSQNWEDFFVDIGKTKFVLLAYLVSLTVKDVKPTLYKFRWFFYGHVFLIASLGVYQGYFGYHLQDWSWVLESKNGIRVKGFFSGTMTYSYVFGMIFAYIFGLIVYCRSYRFRYVLLGVTLFTIGYSLVLTYTRGVWLAIIAAFLLGLLLSFRRKFWKKIALGLVLLSLILGLSRSVTERFLSIGSSDNKSNSIRLELWDVHGDIIKDNIFIGVGLNRKWKTLEQYYNVNSQKFNFIGHAHNNSIEVFASSGLIGFMLYILFFGSLFMLNIAGFRKSQTKQEKGVLLAGILVQIVFHIGGITECTILDQEIIYTFVLLSLSSLSFSSRQISCSWK